MAAPHEPGAQLIASIIAGNTKAFNALVNSHGGFIFTMAMRFTGGRRELCEEITQDVFLKLVKALPTFTGQAKFSTWVYKITYNTAMSALRQKQMYTLHGADELPEGPEAANWLHDNWDIKQHIQHALQQLPPDDAVLLSLHYLQEQNAAEIAYITGYNANTIRVKLLRARQRMRALLAKTIKYDDYR